MAEEADSRDAKSQPFISKDSANRSSSAARDSARPSSRCKDDRPARVTRKTWVCTKGTSPATKMAAWARILSEERLDRLLALETDREPVPAHDIGGEKPSRGRALAVWLELDQQAAARARLVDMAPLGVPRVGGQPSPGGEGLCGVHVAQGPVVEVSLGQIGHSAGSVVGVRVRSLAPDVAVQQPDGRLGTHPVEESGQVLGHLRLRVADALHAVAPRRAIDLHLGPAGAKGDRRGRQREAAVIGPRGS